MTIEHVAVVQQPVRRYSAADQPPVYPARRPRPTQLTPHLGSLAERWAQGCQNARHLYHALVQRGYKGSASMVRNVLQPWRVRPQASPPGLPSAQLSRLLLQPATGLTEAERETLAGILDANPLLAQGSQRPTRFQTLVAERDVGAFAPWLHEAETSDVPAFRSLARSFRQDTEATLAALTTPWSTGQREGQICRVKLLKRLGYGRATLDLLRQRIVHRMPVPVLPVQRDHEVERPVAA